MTHVFYSTVLGLIFCPQNIVALTFPPPVSSPSLIKIRNYTMAKYVDSEFAVLDCIALIEKWGYSAEEHRIITEDGYKIKVHRILDSPIYQKSKGKPVVYLQHGLLAASESWVLQGPKKDLAFMLADAGYDVWLGNIRGNSYGRSHVKLSPDTDPKFWRFSYHEIALYDLTANIDYMLNVTQEKTLIYVGHSQGTTASYALLSTRPEYNSKIRLLVSLSPVVFWRHNKLPPFVKYLVRNGGRLLRFIEDLRIFEVFPQSAMNMLIGKSYCSDASIFQPFCIAMFFQCFGLDIDQMVTSMLPLIFSYFPAGASTGCFGHYQQNMFTGNFQLYDHGSARKNVAKYNQTKPPFYNLKNVVVPVALFVGNGDVLSSPQDVRELEKSLPNVVISEAVPHKYFNHLDFVFARDVKILLYDRLMRLLSKYRNDKRIN